MVDEIVQQVMLFFSKWTREIHTRNSRNSTRSLVERRWWGSGFLAVGERATQSFWQGSDSHSTASKKYHPNHANHGSWTWIINEIWLHHCNKHIRNIENAYLQSNETKGKDLFVCLEWNGSILMTKKMVHNIFPFLSAINFFRQSCREPYGQVIGDFRWSQLVHTKFSQSLL